MNSSATLKLKVAARAVVATVATVGCACAVHTRTALLRYRVCARATDAVHGGFDAEAGAADCCDSSPGRETARSDRLGFASVEPLSIRRIGRRIGSGVLGDTWLSFKDATPGPSASRKKRSCDTTMTVPGYSRRARSKTEMAYGSPQCLTSSVRRAPSRGGWPPAPSPGWRSRR